MKKLALIAILTLCLLGTIAWVATRFARSFDDSTQARNLRKEAALIKVASSPAPRLNTFVSENRNSKDPHVQDLVGAARIRVAYNLASSGKYLAARKQLLEADRDYRGTGAMSPEWGSVPDQAAYQAIACLMAERRNAEAKKELMQFLKERPLSPLVHAAHRRLSILGSGKAGKDADALLQAAIERQEARIRFETSVCGPKAIERLLKELPTTKRQLGYKELAVHCRTTDSGTTIEGIRKGLTAVGLDSFAYRLNSADLRKVVGPAILLEGDHFLVLLGIDGTSAKVYDPRYNSERAVPLPDLADPDFSVATVLLHPLEDNR